ncbi:immunity 26/phosphotriesterase HocA family protein [Streptomyces sp. NBC_00572]|uniref:immunity 26/phosphotriesterase HocA family protein n=1 Tax=Streptomyces sp. NBC_00572 TaxID=2903664 RepID=UPI00225434FF|nr:immunity 26/phosphotriesterase HocA family protein [Streptomyces sp. NBC_00572]MCX4985881.1 immunity 26/phosphotriesterase HocA family protein [Streptomyces sp. NBC_00572]
MTQPGTYVRIPLPDGSYGYGRVLSEEYTGFYDYRTAQPSADLADLDAGPFLFAQAVRLPDDDRWQPIGSRPLEGEAARPVVRFTQDLADFRKCVIFDSEGGMHPATPEECVGLERAEVWDAHHIERRLLDTFLGLPNQDEREARVRLS